MLTNNDVLRRVRYTFDLEDDATIALFKLGGLDVTRAQISDWLKRDEDPAFQELNDFGLASFLNGFIIKRRGKREGPQPVAETRLYNNRILVKLKIALKLTSDDILPMISTEESPMSPHELSAFFRKPDHKHYRPCKDQVLRRFLNGMQKRFRP